MNCKTARKFFDELWALGDQFPNESIATHVRECPMCSSEYAQWSSIAHKFSRAAPLQPPQGLAHHILARINEQRLREELVSTTQGKSVWAAVWGMASLVILCTTGIFLVPRQSVVTQSQAEYKHVTFEVSFAGAQEVAIAGDFNRWDAEQYRLSRTDRGTWEITLQLRSGAYQYQFLVDGRIWKPDPGNPIAVPDGFGGVNSGIEI